MTHINFYRINGDFDAALKLACQLAEKAFQQGMTTLIHTGDSTVSEQLDQLLWSFKPSAFLPHEVEVFPAANIAISHQDEPGDHHGLLINLQSSTPNWFPRFEKAVEIVYDDDQVIKQKREQFSFYKHRGYPMKYHDLTQSR